MSAFGCPSLTQCGSSCFTLEASSVRRAVVSNKPAFLCLLWENPQTPQRHWSLAGQGHRASPRRPGCHNQGGESCLHQLSWRQEDGGRNRLRGADESDCGRGRWRVCLYTVSAGVRTCWREWWRDTRLSMKFTDLVNKLSSLEAERIWLV